MGKLHYRLFYKAQPSPTSLFLRHKVHVSKKFESLEAKCQPEYTHRATVSMGVKEKALCLDFLIMELQLDATT